MRTAKDIAFVAVMTALLIGCQYLLSVVPGVEVVTVLLLCFAYSFGAVRAVFVATAFSLLCGFLHGFDVKSFVLYLLYYNAFALLFGLIGGGIEKKNEGKRKAVLSVVGTQILFCLLIAFPIVFYIVVIPHISRVLRGGMRTLAVIILCISAVGAVVYNVFLWLRTFSAKEGVRRFAAQGASVASVVATAAVCTISFTLLDDLLYPVFYGAWGDPAIAYFYAAFPFMIPQTVCTIVTVSLFFPPLYKIFDKARKSLFK